jgi:hypothetical protein
MSVRIGFRIAQFGRDTILQLFRNEMLQALGFFVNLFKQILLSTMNARSASWSSTTRIVSSFPLRESDINRLSGKNRVQNQDKAGRDTARLAARN